jgi:colanic acid biosynthesis glycosyl transferase WcaI
MGPISAVWALAMRERGHVVDVITAHPHYPPDVWRQRFLPRRDQRERLTITRLPLWGGHRTTGQRVREEVTYALSAAVAMPTFRTPDAIVSVSPSFAALAPMLVNARLRGVPLVLWLQDILPDAAVATGLLRNAAALRTARALERAAYRAAQRIVVVSETFEENLLRKGVPSEKLVRIHNPATRGFATRRSEWAPTSPRLLYMGNMGYSQGLAEFVRAFEQTGGRGELRLVITGSGEVAEAVRAEIRSDRVEMLGLVDDERLEAELDRAALGLVTQRGDIDEFNIPSKLMTLMARGVPILANVAPTSEAARIVKRSGGGWVADSAKPAEAAELACTIARDPEELRRRGAAASEFARQHFSADVFADRFEAVLQALLAASPGTPARVTA